MYATRSLGYRSIGERGRRPLLRTVFVWPSHNDVKKRRGSGVSREESVGLETRVERAEPKRERAQRNR
jgi:hypothetical protein